MELMAGFEPATSSLPIQFSLFYLVFLCHSLLTFLLYMLHYSSCAYRSLLFLAAAFRVVVFLAGSGFVVVNIYMETRPHDGGGQGSSVVFIGKFAHEVNRLFCAVTWDCLKKNG